MVIGGGASGFPDTEISAHGNPRPRGQCSRLPTENAIGAWTIRTEVDAIAWAMCTRDGHTALKQSPSGQWTEFGMNRGWRPSTRYVPISASEVVPLSFCAPTAVTVILKVLCFFTMGNVTLGVRVSVPLTFVLTVRLNVLLGC